MENLSEFNCSYFVFLFAIKLIINNLYRKNSERKKQIKEQSLNLSRHFCLKLFKSWLKEAIFKRLDETEIEWEHPLTLIKKVLSKSWRSFSSTLSLTDMNDNFNEESFDQEKIKSLIKLNDLADGFTTSLLDIDLANFLSKEFQDTSSIHLEPYSEIKMNCYWVSEMLLLEIYSTLYKNKISISHKELFEAVIAYS